MIRAAHLLKASARSRFFNLFLIILIGISILVVSTGTSASGLFSLDQSPISYYTTEAGDRVSEFARRLEVGEKHLSYHPQFGYLPDLLENLGVSVESQGLVFSKTSFQGPLISPENPRALYFSDDVYVGWVRGGDVIEISAVDPRQGGMFYSLDQDRTDHPQIVRQTDACLQCHASPLTEGVPGHLARSVFVDPKGQPILKAGTFLTTDRSPFKERWGGWYVTGTHGMMRHLGNSVLADSEEAERFDMEKGANLQDLSGLFDTSAYLSSHSDIVALMVLEHQAHFHNLIASANYQARMAMLSQKDLNQLDGKPEDYIGPSTLKRFDYAIDPLLKALLFTEEAELKSAVTGTSGFAGSFAELGPRDKKGRSLRDFDLRRRLFRYPCSFLIYSESVDALPAPLKDRLYKRLWEILIGQDKSSDFEKVTEEERRAVYEILVETKKDLPEYWFRAS